MRKIWGLFILPCLLALGIPLLGQIAGPRPIPITEAYSVEQFRDSWRVLEPITRGNLSIFPVVSRLRADTSGFMTLDEGVAAGVIKISERGQLESPLYRNRDGVRPPRTAPSWPLSGGPSVNELVLVNESSRPLILLAGEVVSGGKQNRIVGADLVVPPKSGPVPLNVFCVEHGRWTPGAGGFGSAQAIAHPKIRMQAELNQSQTGVWDAVGGAAMAARAPSPTQSYVDVLQNPEVKRDLDSAAASIEGEYDRELRDRIREGGAVGVVVAIDGELVWSDVFPSAQLFGKYWPKLLRSYLMESKGYAPWGKGVPSAKAAEKFLLECRGHVNVDTEAEAYRRTQISTDAYQVVALEALGESEKVNLLLHYNKMARG